MRATRDGLARAIPVILLTGCAGDPASSEDQAAVELTVVTYNVAQLDGGARQAQVAGVLTDLAPDVVALQECVGCGSLADALPDLELAAAPRAGVSVLYDARRWAPTEDPVALVLGEDDDGWGERVAQVVPLTSLDTGRVVVVVATHFCVPIRRPDDACDEGRQLEYVETILDDLVARGHTAAVVAGDLNVFDGFEAGAVVGRLERAGLVNLYRAVEPDGAAITFAGNDWAPPGRLDYVFATAPAVAGAASIHDDAPAGTSDHFAVSAAVEFPAADRR